MRGREQILTIRRLPGTAEDRTIDRVDTGTTPWVRLRVHDTGIGMDVRTRERLFDPYCSTKGPGRGTGLGLPIVQSVVLSLNGRIDVESIPLEGTTFHRHAHRHTSPAGGR